MLNKYEEVIMKRRSKKILYFGVIFQRGKHNDKINIIIVEFYLINNRCVWNFRYNIKKV